MKYKTVRTAAALGAGAVLLVACGGGDDVAPPPAAPPPPQVVSGSDVPLSATQSANAAFDFVAGVAANKSETAEPLVVGDATLATTDTEEPRALQ
jgi:hypothetical protein